MSKSGKDLKDDKYIVGKGKPPKHSQWKPGQSGNPAGRQASCLNKKTIRTAIEKVFFVMSVGMRSESGVRETPVLEAFLLKLRNKALEGDLHAMRLVLKLLDWAPDEPETDDSRETTEQDIAILAWHKNLDASTSGDSEDDDSEENSGNEETE